MVRKTTESKTRCEYCGKKLVVQDEQGRNADGNRVVLEVDGSQKRACRSCADRLSMGLSPGVPEDEGSSGSKAG